MIITHEAPRGCFSYAVLKGECPLKAFYGARFSAHMTKTPEGFLVCHSVPICRTGMQEYMPQELGVKARDGGFLEVYREESEVFKPAAVASFEGKPVTDDHPPVGVDASNYASYTKGTVQNVRRGSGADRDKLICDLVVYDAALIAKIEAGKREISCGYECKYIERDDGTYCQMDIIGNHVAVVEEGRAGSEVAIRDAKAKPEGGKQMAKKGSILHRMFAAFVKDAEPEEVREAARAVDEAEGGGTPDEPQETQDKDVAELMDAVAALNAKVDAFTKAQTQDDDPNEEPDEKSEETETLDELEEELEESDPEPTEDDESEEESVTVPPEQLEDEEPEETPADDPQPAPTADKALALSVIRTMRPFIATMPTGQQRRAADALSRTLKKAMCTRDTQPLAGGYGALSHRRKTADAAALAQSMRAFGENCRKRNPHCKKEEK